MKATTLLSSGMLLAGGLIVSCSSSGSSNGVMSVGSSGTGTGGATGSAGTTGANGGATASGGATGSGGGGVMPVGGKCVQGALKHPDGLCYCQPATLTTCSDGCFDPQVDADHCGDCTTKCAAAQVCNAGKCGTTPNALVPAAAGCGAIHLAVSAGTLYWTDKMHGTVKSAPTATGGAGTSVSTGEMAPTTIAVNGTSLFWLDTGTKSIMTASTTGGAAKVVVTSTDDINGFTLSADGMTVYFAHGTTISKTTAAPAGAVTEVGHEDTGVPHALSVEGTLIGYPTDVNGDFDIMTMSDTPAVCASADSTTMVNKNCVRVARSQGSLNFENAYIIMGHAYWANQAQIQTALASDVTGADSPVASGSPDASTLPAFSISNSTVFFADDTGLVYKAPLMVNAEVTSLARGQMGVTSIVADDSNVYWATGDCAIMSSALK